MEIFIRLVLMLILINGLFLLLVAILTMDSPFKLGILSCLTLTNCLVFFLTALVASDNPASAMLGFAARILPGGLVLLGLAAIIFVQTYGTAKKNG